MAKKIILVILGNVIIGLGVGLSVYCNLGIDPSTTFFTGVNNQLNLGLGNCITLGNAFLFIPMFIVERKTIHLGTFVNMFAIGYIVQYSSAFFIQTLPVLSFPIRLLVTCCAILTVCIGCGLYLSCNMGQAPWDSVAHLININFPKIKYSTGRMVQDIIALFLGYLMGATLGIASIIFAFFLGPGIHFFKTNFQKLFFAKESQN